MTFIILKTKTIHKLKNEIDVLLQEITTLCSKIGTVCQQTREIGAS